MREAASRVRLVDAKERRFQKLPIEIWIERSWYGWKVLWQMPDLSGGPISYPRLTFKRALSKQAKLISAEQGMKAATLKERETE